MCLGIPGEVVEIREDLGMTVAKVKFGGITKEVCLQCIDDVGVGDFVLVHVGFAIAKVDRVEAERAYKTLEELGLLADLHDDAPTRKAGS